MATLDESGLQDTLKSSTQTLSAVQNNEQFPQFEVEPVENNPKSKIRRKMTRSIRVKQLRQFLKQREEGFNLRFSQESCSSKPSGTITPQ